VPNTNAFRNPLADDPVAFGRWAADRIEEAILFEGADTVAAVFLEPVQNSGGCFTPPPGYFARVREICDRHDVLLVSDEVICAFGRHGATFACEKFGYQPDMITCAKGMSSGYGAIGAMIASERVIEPFLRPGVAFPHGYTFGGHPVAAAVSLANLDLAPSVVGSLRGSVSSSGQSMVKPGGVGSGVTGSPPGRASTGSGMDTAASRAWPPKSGCPFTFTSSG